MTAVTRPRSVAILQARMSSSRLPGKVLMPLADRSLIAFMIERVRRATAIDELVLATSVETSDDPLVDAIERLGVRVVRGPLDDVLARFGMAAELAGADIVVRLTGDCPLIDPVLIDRVVAKIASGEALYASNCVPATYPDGLDCEAFGADLLNRAVREATLASEREHVTPWIRQFAGDRSASIECAIDLSGLRWTVDYPEDLQTVRAMVDYLGHQALSADLFDLLRAYDALGGATTGHDRNEGYAKSLAADNKNV